MENSLKGMLNSLLITVKWSHGTRSTLLEDTDEACLPEDPGSMPFRAYGHTFRNIGPSKTARNLGHADEWALGYVVEGGEYDFKHLEVLAFKRVPAKPVEC